MVDRMSDKELKAHIDMCRRIQRKYYSRKNAMYYKAISDKKICLAELNRRKRK